MDLDLSRIRRWRTYLFLKVSGWHISRWADIFSFPHRLNGYRLLSSAKKGVEIGAFNCPSALPPICKVEYFDLQTKSEAIKLFPEIDARRLVNVNILGNLDRDGLGAIESNSLDFCVANHILEHVANPIYILEEIIRMVKQNGFLVLSIPDKRFSFDSPRELTSFKHLLEEYREQVNSITDEHYIDFVKAVYPKEYALGKSAWLPHFEAAKARHEHAHVWDSVSFESFLETAFSDLFKVKATRLFKSVADENQYEYFSVWQILAKPGATI